MRPTGPAERWEWSSRGITVDALVSLALGTAACIGYNSLTRFHPQAIAAGLLCFPDSAMSPPRTPAQQAASRTRRPLARTCDRIWQDPLG